MQQTPVRDFYAAEILYYFFKHLNDLKYKTSKLVVDLVEGYNFHIKIIFI